MLFAVDLFAIVKTRISFSRGNLLISFLVVYLLVSRLVPLAVSSDINFLLRDKSSSFDILQVLKFIARSPNIHSTRSKEEVMGTACCKGATNSNVVHTTTIVLLEEGVTEEEQHTVEEEEEEQLPCHELDPEGRVHQRKGSFDSHLDDVRKMKSTERRDSTQSTPADKSINDTPLVKFKDIEDSLQTGDLALLYRHGESQPNFGIFINHGECDPYFPLLLIKGKTKPLPLGHFNSSHRDVRIITAVTRIFYGDYERVAIRRLKAGQHISCSEALDVAEKVERDIGFTQQELMFITEATSDVERSLYTCTFALSHVYKGLGIMMANPVDIRPDTFQDALPLSPPIYIKLPSLKHGPLIGGSPPLLSQLADGIRHPPEFPVANYSDMRDQLKTGDIILFSGATSTGALIKIFDGAIFSHVGLVLRPRYSSYVMIWESSTNKAGMVDVDTGSVRKGVELLPLRNKIFSGWYNRVAVRQLIGLTDEQRQQLYENMLKIRKDLQGRPYEKNHLELVMSAIDIDEGYLDFLRTDHEDLSSIFCSELVAHVYQELGLIGKCEIVGCMLLYLDKTRLSNSFTPDDFASHRDMSLNYGNLQTEVYLNLKFDYQKQLYRQTSIPAHEAV